MPRVFHLAAALALAAAPAMAQFEGSLTAGDLEFDLALQAPFPDMGPMLLRPSNLVAASEPDRSQLNQFSWFYHLAGDPRSYVFNSSGGQQVQTVGDTITVTQHYQGWDGITAYTLVSTGDNRGYLASTATIHHLGTAPLTLSLFHYADLDVNGTFTDDTASLTAPGEMSLQDPVGPLALGWNAITAPSAYQVTPWRDLLADLTSTRTQLDNTGLPFGPGDFVGAWQWDLVVPAGGSLTIEDRIAIIPAPGAACLAALGLLAAARRRRR
jgi:hypothetical protein